MLAKTRTSFRIGRFMKHSFALLTLAPVRSSSILKTFHSKVRYRGSISRSWRPWRIWGRASAPRAIIGLYGPNTLTRVAPSDVQLARHVDAFFAPMYTFDDDRSAWELAPSQKLEKHACSILASGLLLPMPHDHISQQFQFIRADYWKFQLESARRYGDGVVLWTPSRYE
jgi:hypothetical protein